MVVARQPEREAMPFAQRPDARIWWDQSGTGDPVLLIMGHAYGADMWHRTAPERPRLTASYGSTIGGSVAAPTRLGPTPCS